MTVDFVPPENLRGARVQVQREAPVVVMFMNKRAAEHLTARQHDAACAWARAAVLQEPSFLAAVNSLAIICLRSGHLPRAEAALRHVLAQVTRRRARELRRQPYQHEAHYWAGVADAAPGNTAGAEKHLRQAIEHSGSAAVGARYSAKLAMLNSPSRQ